MFSAPIGWVLVNFVLTKHSGHHIGRKVKWISFNHSEVAGGVFEKREKLENGT
jgi:hypothetical protein